MAAARRAVLDGVPALAVVAVCACGGTDAARPVAPHAIARVPAPKATLPPGAVQAALPHTLADLQIELRTHGAELLTQYTLKNIVVDDEQQDILHVQREQVTPFLRRWDPLLRDKKRIDITCEDTLRDVVCFQLGDPELFFHFSGSLPSLVLEGVTEISVRPPSPMPPPGPVRIIPL